MQWVPCPLANRRPRSLGVYGYSGLNPLIFMDPDGNVYIHVTGSKDLQKAGAADARAHRERIAKQQGVDPEDVHFVAVSPEDAKDLIGTIAEIVGAYGPDEPLEGVIIYTHGNAEGEFEVGGDSGSNQVTYEKLENLRKDKEVAEALEVIEKHQKTGRCDFEGCRVGGAIEEKKEKSVPALLGRILGLEEVTGPMRKVRQVRTPSGRVIEEVRGKPGSDYHESVEDPNSPDVGRLPAHQNIEPRKRISP